jgi:hypothetical protein
MPDFSRQNSGSGTNNTLDEDPITFAFMEFLSNSDSTTMKGIWKKWKFQDVSPFWADKPTVPTFNDKKYIPQWPDYRKAMVDVRAHWYYISGHHGRRYASDSDAYDNFHDHFHGVDDAGFFNEPYHQGPWDHASYDEPDAKASDNDIYMTSSKKSVFKVLGENSNPLYISGPQGQCLGLLLVGCRSLTYTADRKRYTQQFPNAVVIGEISRESNAILKIKKIADKYGAAFFRDPKSVDPAELARLLNKSDGPAPAFDQMGVLSDGTLYTYVGKKDYAVAHDEALPEEAVPT